MTYIKELDIIRFFAFLLVFVSHYTYFFREKDGLTYYLTQGDVGVQIFFVLSGFLITTLLFLEKERTGNINFKNFYMRRILRIWPLYFLIVALGLTTAAFQGKLDHTHMWSLFTFLSNFTIIKDDQFYLPLAILWSLAVEEQYYLIWPPLVYFLKTKYLKILLLASIVISFWFKYYGTDIWEVAAYHTVSNISYLAIGSYFALTIKNKYFGKLIVASNKLIHFARIGSSSTLVYLGKISYGLYMYHIFALMLLKSFLPSLALTILFAHVSYKYFEQPILKKYKSRFTSQPIAKQS
jgi:peptidoglycan/LPS O-acetylase OafA/YrhL